MVQLKRDKKVSSILKKFQIKFEQMEKVHAFIQSNCDQLQSFNKRLEKLSIKLEERLTNLEQ